MENNFLSSLEWRNAQKSFDPNKKVEDKNIEKILYAIRMAPSSYGLQPYHIHVVTNAELKLKLKEKAFGQAQVSDASHFVVFLSRLDLDDRIDKYFDISSGENAESREKMKPYEDMMKSFSAGKTEEQIKNWADRQTYIALGFAMVACAELGIDSCPMEGFSPTDFDTILELPSNMKSVVSLAIGYRKEDPSFPKMRFPDEDLFTIVR